MCCVRNFIRGFGKLEENNTATYYLKIRKPCRESIPRKPRTTVAITVGLLLPKPRKRIADDTMVAVVKYT